MDERERRRIIDQTLVHLEKQFGKGAVLRLGSTDVEPISVISTGAISIDAALGVGGFPRRDRAPLMRSLKVIFVTQVK